MATNRTRILPGAGGIPDSTGDVFWQPWSIVTGVTNDVWQHQVLTFRASGSAALYYGTFAVPQDYNSAPTMVIRFASGLSTGVVKWTVAYVAVAGDGSESLDALSATETISNTTDASSAKTLFECDLNFTAANFAAGDLVQFYIQRDSSDAADTLAAPANVFEAFFEYGT